MAECAVVALAGRAVRRNPGRTAVVAEGTRLSYADLGRRIERWEERIRALRLPPGSLVAAVADGQPDLPAAFLGIRAAGQVPMLLDGLLAESRTAEIIELARPAAVAWLGRDEVAARDPAGGSRNVPRGAGYLVFSSGSQGMPKAIVGRTEGLAHFVAWEAAELGIGPGDRVASLTSPAFDVVFRDLLLPLAAGAELHLAESRVRAVPSAVLPWLAEHRIGVLHAVPSLSARWLAADRAGTPLDALRWTLFAGEPLHSGHVERWRAAAPSSRVLNLYGPSETTLAKFRYEVPPDPAPGLQPVGRPLPQTEYELEPDPSAPDARRVVISTPHGSLGYLDGLVAAAEQARLTRAGGITRFQTQDRGFVDARGDLVIAGRLDTLVKRNGAFVDTARVEAAAAALPEVRAACCLQLEPGGAVGLAVAGPAPGEAAGLRRKLRPVLGTDLPDLVAAVPELPLLPGGKTDRHAVRALLEKARGT